MRTFKWHGIPVNLPSTKAETPVVSTKQVPVAIELPPMIPVQPTSAANPIATVTPELTSTFTRVIPSVIGASSKESST